DRGEREQDNASGQNVGKAIRDSGKGIGGQGDAIGAFIEVFSSDDDGNGGKATDNDGVQKWLPCRNQSFFCRTTVFGNTVCQRCGTNAGDSGKACALNTVEGSDKESAGV